MDNNIDQNKHNNLQILENSINETSRANNSQAMQTNSSMNLSRGNHIERLLSNSPQPSTNIDNEKLLTEYQLALRQSNDNLLTLKDSLNLMIRREREIKEQLANTRKKLEDTYSEYLDIKKLYEEKRNLLESALEEINTKNKLLVQKDELIIGLRKTLDVFSARNFINDDEEKSSDPGRPFDKSSYEIQSLQLKINEMNIAITNKNLTERNLLKEIEALKWKLKETKSQLKDELSDKIKILKSLEEAKKSYYEKKGNESDLSAELNSLKKQNEKLSQIIKSSELSNLDLNKIIDVKNKEINKIKSNYIELKDCFEKAIDEMSKKNNKDLEKKYDHVLAQMNYWKVSFTDIAKYKLISENIQHDNSIDPLSDKMLLQQKEIIEEERSVMRILQVDSSVINDIPMEIRQEIDFVTLYFKRKIDEEHSRYDEKSIKEIIQKDILLTNDLKNEMHLRRKIHNRYMLVRGNMRLFVRIRPFISSEQSFMARKAFSDSIKINSDSIFACDSDRRERHYEFDYVFNQRTLQQNIHEEVSLLLQNMFSGLNICIFAYGQTCTGKTYTIEGPNSNPGLVLRTAKELFQLGGCYKGFQLSLTIVEIYNENILDLLDNGKTLSLYEDNSGNLLTPDLNCIIVTSFEEVVKLLKLSKKMRNVASNGFHNKSSRSHCIYTFKLRLEQKSRYTSSQINIVDLAGSERLTRHNTVMDDLLKREAVSINLSLNALSNVLSALNHNSNSHIPYRDSKLTHFLKPYLNHSYNILLILHISPNVKDINETISTLDFGSRISRLCNHKTGKEKIHLVHSNSMENLK